MSETQASRSVVVTNPEGLHLRAAMLVAARVRQGRSRVFLVKGDQRADAAEVLQLAMLTAGPGTLLQIEASGPDAEEVVAALVQMFASNFGEPTENNRSEASERSC